MSTLESVASSRRRVKENVRIDELIPLQLREEAAKLIELLDAYYDFMSLHAYKYKLENQSYFATVVNGNAIFKADRNDFFYDDELVETKLFDSEGNEIPMAGVLISGTDNLPHALETDFDGQSYGSLFSIVDGSLSAFELKQLQLVTPVVRYIGDNPTRVLNSLLEQRDLDTISEDYLQQLQKEIAASIPRSLQSDQKILYKNITQFYRERGSEESIRIFFELLLNDEVEISYPGEQMLIPSSGKWDQNDSSYRQTYDSQGNELGLTLQPGAYIDNTGFVSDLMKLQDSSFYQKFSYLIKTGSNIETWENAFNKLIHPAGFKFFGQIVIFIILAQRNSIMPDNQPGLIGAEDLPLLVQLIGSLVNPDFTVRLNRSAQSGTLVTTGGVIDYLELVDLGYGYPVAPTLTVTDTGTGAGATFSLSIDDAGQIIPDGKTADGIAFVVPTNGGTNYEPVTTGIALGSNPSAGTVAHVDVNRKLKFNGTPTITFSAPISASGTTAAGTAQLDSNGRLIGINITNAGAEYQTAPTIKVDGTIDKLAELAFYLILEMGGAISGNPGDLDERTSERWVDFLHFFDATPMYTFEGYTFNDFINDRSTILSLTNVGAQIYGYDDANFTAPLDVYDPTNFNDISYKLANTELRG